MEVLEDSDDDHSSETNENETNENDPLTLNPVVPRPKRREIRPPTFTGENNIDAPKRRNNDRAIKLLIFSILR